MLVLRNEPPAFDPSAAVPIPIPLDSPTNSRIREVVKARLVILL